MDFQLITTIFFLATAFVIVMGAIITFLDDKSKFLAWIKPTWFYRYFWRIALILVIGTILFSILSNVL